MVSKVIIYISLIIGKKKKENFWLVGSLGCLHLGQHGFNENVKLHNMQVK